jgi:hypothetical protein
MVVKEEKIYNAIRREIVVQLVGHSIFLLKQEKFLIVPAIVGNVCLL